MNDSVDENEYDAKLQNQLRTFEVDIFDVQVQFDQKTNACVVLIEIAHDESRNIEHSDVNNA